MKTCTKCKENKSIKLFGKRKASKDNLNHCHKTKKIRGLLCTACNTALGLFKDDLKRLSNAINYLKEQAEES
jgi:hypothetical protein